MDGMEWDSEWWHLLCLISTLKKTEDCKDTHFHANSTVYYQSHDDND